MVGTAHPTTESVACGPFGLSIRKIAEFPEDRQPCNVTIFSGGRRKHADRPSRRQLTTDRCF
jgi:hypothetical protein